MVALLYSAPRTLLLPLLHFLIFFTPIFSTKRTLKKIDLLHLSLHQTPRIPQPLNDCRSRRGLNDCFAEFDSTEDDEKILRVPKEYVLRVLNSTGALIREECEIECSRGIFTASPGKISITKYM